MFFDWRKIFLKIIENHCPEINFSLSDLPGAPLKNRISPVFRSKIRYFQHGFIEILHDIHPMMVPQVLIGYVIPLTILQPLPIHSVSVRRPLPAT